MKRLFDISDIWPWKIFNWIFSVFQKLTFDYDKGQRATDTTSWMYNILKNSSKWCYNMFFQAKYLFFVSSLRCHSIFQKSDNFLEISFN